MNSLEVVVSLWLHPDKQIEFEAYEVKAVRIMRSYGGVLHKSVRINANQPQTEAPPFEIYVLSFPSLESFNSYRADPQLVALASERETAISRTEVLLGKVAPEY